MTTFSASDIITDALQKLGVYAPGEQLSDADLSRGFITLNDMIDQWSNEFVFIYTLTPLALSLLVGANAYTIGGQGQSITSQRPSRIVYGPGEASVVISGTTTPVNVVSALEWQAIQSINAGDGTPDTLWYDPQYPVGVLNVAPNPTAVGVLTFYTFVPFTAFADTSTKYDLAQGTDDALKTNLAVSLKPYFSSATVDPVVVSRAETSKYFIRISNTTSRAMIKRSLNPTGQPGAQGPKGNS